MGDGSLLAAVTDGFTFMTSRYDTHSLRCSLGVFFLKTTPGEAEDLVLAFGTPKTCNIRDDLAATRQWHQSHCDRPAVAQSRFDRFDADTCGEEDPAQDLLRLILSTFTPHRSTGHPSSVGCVVSYPLWRIRLFSHSFFLYSLSILVL